MSLNYKSYPKSVLIENHRKKHIVGLSLVEVIIFIALLSLLNIVFMKFIYSVHDQNMHSYQKTHDNYKD